MFCTQCGTKLDDSARFCTACGKPTNVPPSPASATNLAFGEYASGEYVPPRRLRRLPRQGKISGVCAGYAEYFSMDLTLMRLIWVALLLIPPSLGFVAYIVSWIVLPKE